MTEQTAPTGTENAPAPETTPAPLVDNSSTEDKRYAAYDDTYERFLPGVFKTKKDASTAAKAGGSKKFTVREV